LRSHIRSKRGSGPAPLDNVSHLGYTFIRDENRLGQEIDMSKTAMIRARTELKLKSKVERIFEALGLTASQAINLFYHRVELENGLPFDLKIPNPATVHAIMDVENKKNLHSYSHAETMLKDLKK